MPSGIRWPLVLLLFAFCAWKIAPDHLGTRRILVPSGLELDAVQECLLVADGVDKLRERPTRYYDTAILYPDHHQLRSTEPLLGYALLALPLRTVLHLDAVDAMKVLRWLLLFAALTYSCLLLESLGVEFPLAVAGALLCVATPLVLASVERLQFLAMPLVTAPTYHLVMTVRGGRHRAWHAGALFVWSLLYPLLGAVNLVVAFAAGFFALPWLVRRGLSLWRGEQASAWWLSILLAAVVDAVLLAPWLLNRGDLAAYTEQAFLEIKNWGGTPPPINVQQTFEFARNQFGLAMILAVGLIGLIALQRRFGKTLASPMHLEGPRFVGFAVLVSLFVAMTVVSSPGQAPSLGVWIGVLYQVGCLGTLLWFWRQQWLLEPDRGEQGTTFLALGLAVFLCLLSFGPAYATRPVPLATYLTRGLLHLVPALSAMREFGRTWIPGMLCLAIAVTLQLASWLRGSARWSRALVAVVIAAASVWNVSAQSLVASDDIATPAALTSLASHASKPGPLYVHPNMRWNTLVGALMIGATRELRRPIVDGYLGICPPWYSYATKVLDRFPDAEAIWLLRHWRVGTVVDIIRAPGAESSEFLRRVWDEGTGAVYEVDLDAPAPPHPSLVESPGPAGSQTVEARWQPVGLGAHGRDVLITVPPGFTVHGVRCRFGVSIVDDLPEAIDVFQVDSEGKTRVNREHSGDWIESLAAAALVERRQPVATVAVTPVNGGALLIRFRHAQRPPIRQIVLIGEGSR